MKAKLVYIKKRDWDFDPETGESSELTTLHIDEWVMSSEPKEYEEELWEPFVLIPVEDE